MYDKFLWGKDSLIWGLAKNGTVGFMICMITRRGHSAITARADLYDALLTTHKLESPWSIFHFAGSVDGKCKGWFSVSHLPAMGNLTQDGKSGMHFLSKEGTQDLPGSRAYGFIFHPDASLASLGEVLTNSSCCDWSTTSSVIIL